VTREAARELGAKPRLHAELLDRDDLRIALAYGIDATRPRLESHRMPRTGKAERS
jgi:hypothetical protein